MHAFFLLLTNGHGIVQAAIYTAAKNKGCHPLSHGIMPTVCKPNLRKLFHGFGKSVNALADKHCLQLFVIIRHFFV